MTSLGYEVCAVRTVEIKPGTAEQNVLKLINSTWLESQVPIYNIPPPSLLYLVCIPGSKHASIMMNTPNWDPPTGHQSGQENKHANTHTHHQITAQRRDKTDTGKADGKVVAPQHKNTGQNHNNQSPRRKQTREVRYIKLLQKAQSGAVAYHWWNTATQLLGFFLQSFTELMIFHFKSDCLNWNRLKKEFLIHYTFGLGEEKCFHAYNGDKMTCIFCSNMLLKSYCCSSFCFNLTV